MFHALEHNSELTSTVFRNISSNTAHTYTYYTFSSNPSINLHIGPGPAKILFTMNSNISILLVATLDKSANADRAKSVFSMLQREKYNVVFFNTQEHFAHML